MFPEWIDSGNATQHVGAAIQMEYGPQRETATEEANRELSQLCKLLDVYFQAGINLRRGLSPSVKEVEFKDLWYIFKAGDEVRTPKDNMIQLYVLSSFT